MPFLPDPTLPPTDFYNNRISAVTGSGGYCRIRYRPDLTSEYSESDNAGYNVIILPYGTYELMEDPKNEEVTESDSPGRQHPPTMFDYALHIDLRGRDDPISIEALTVLDAVFVDEVFIDKGATGGGWLVQEMWRAPFQRRSPAIEHIKDAVSFIGGFVVSRNLVLPDRFNPDA